MFCFWNCQSQWMKGCVYWETLQVMTTTTTTKTWSTWMCHNGLSHSNVILSPSPSLLFLLKPRSRLQMSRFVSKWNKRMNKCMKGEGWWVWLARWDRQSHNQWQYVVLVSPFLSLSIYSRSQLCELLICEHRSVNTHTHSAWSPRKATTRMKLPERNIVFCVWSSSQFNVWMTRGKGVHCAQFNMLPLQAEREGERERNEKEKKREFN